MTDSRTGLLARPRRAAIAVTLLLVILAAWLANGRTQGSFDTTVSSLIPITLPYSIAIQVIGTYSNGPLIWNADRQVPAALWDFVDNPLARAFR